MCATSAHEQTKSDLKILQSLQAKKFLLKIIPSGSPLKKTYITSRYGKRIHPVTKKHSFHSGIDFRAKIGTKVFATADGKIIRCGKAKSKNAGIEVVISHNEEYKTHYLHLSKVLVKKGDIVRKGDVIALSGNTGRSTGPHLHYSIKINEKSIDPYFHIKWNSKTFTKYYKRINNRYPFES